MASFLEIPNISKCRSLVCIQPHPDDNEISCGGTICKLAASGCDITYITVTNGKIGTINTQYHPTELIEVRKNEQKQAGDYLGVARHIFIDLDDNGDYSVEELTNILIKYIREIKPEMIMAPDPWQPYEAHPDHHKAGLSAVRASLFSEFPHFPYTNGEPHDVWKVKGVILYNTAYPNTFIDIEKVWECKKTAIAFHKSQFTEEELKTYYGYFATYAHNLGVECRHNIAEAFKVLTPEHFHCVVDSIHR